MKRDVRSRFAHPFFALEIELSFLRDLLEEAVGDVVERLLPAWARDLLTAIVFGLGAVFWDSLPQVCHVLTLGFWISMTFGIMSVLARLQERHESLLERLGSSIVVPLGMLSLGIVSNFLDRHPLFDLSAPFLIGMSLCALDGAVFTFAKHSHARRDRVVQRALSQSGIRFVSFFVFALIAPIFPEGFSRVATGDSFLFAAQLSANAAALFLFLAWVRRTEVKERR